jgi:hypothetical protein
MSKVDDSITSEAVARVAAVLARLDAYSFWTVPMGSSGHLVVIGSTGAFMIASCGLEGRFTSGRGAPTVGSYVVPGIRTLRKDAKHAAASLRAASVGIDVEPIVCLTDAVMGGPARAKRVRFVHVRDLVTHISARPRIMEQMRAQRGARALGVKLEGDQKRDFSLD